MKHTLFISATITAVTAVATRNVFLCDIPTAGCANGMFNQVNCTCMCIPPFCPDALGTCITSGTCDDPWKNCERGKNCPWWANPLKAESCTTGPTIPVGTWDIFPSEEICCKTNFPYSEFCTPDTTPPTKHPTIALLEDDKEIVSIQFIASDVPDSIPSDSIEKEMEIVFKRIILRLANKIDGMKVTKVEAAKLSLNLRRQLVLQRSLATEVTRFFHVYLVRDIGKHFGPSIINEIRDSYDDVLTQVQSFSDTKYLNGNLGLNFCTLHDGEYDLCVIEDTDALSPAPAPASSQTSNAAVEPGVADGVLAGWAIALIVILVLSIVCCGGYALAVLCFGVENFFKDQDDAANMDKRFGPMDSLNRLAIKNSTSQYTRKQLTMQGTKKSHAAKQITQGSQVYPDSRTGVQVVCSNPQYPTFDDTSFTINTFSTNRRKTRDPTMFVSGQKSRPDPGTAHSQRRSAHDACSSRRYYSEEHSSKPKREPTMYVEGKVFAIDPILRQKRDPTLCSNMRYELEAIDDDVEYAGSYLDPAVRSQTPSRDGHDTLRGSSSYQTQEQSACANSKSLKSKSSQRSGKHHHHHHHRDSFRTSDSNAPDGKSAFSKFSSHKSKTSKNTSPSSGVFSG